MRLADRLAEAGLACFRFDYDGTGDSAGQQNDPDRVEAWLSSIRCAMELVQGLGANRISAVGMRMGATLLAETFGSGPPVLDDLVLWDSCASGRSFLREQSALWAFALGAEAANDGSIETPGLVYDKETVADMSPLAIANGDGPLAGRVLVLTRTGRNGDRRANERLALPHTERVAIVGQEELVDVLPDAAKIPEETITTIVEWLAAGAAPETEVVIAPDGVGRTVAVVGTTPDGTPVEERAVRLGPIGLFGIATSPVRTDAPAGVRRERPPDHHLLERRRHRSCGSGGAVGPARTFVGRGRIHGDPARSQRKRGQSGAPGAVQEGHLLVPPRTGRRRCAARGRAAGSFERRTRRPLLGRLQFHRAGDRGQGAGRVCGESRPHLQGSGPRARGRGRPASGTDQGWHEGLGRKDPGVQA